MKIKFQKIIQSYHKSLNEYNKNFKSDHWERGYKKKINYLNLKI